MLSFDKLKENGTFHRLGANKDLRVPVKPHTLWCQEAGGALRLVHFTKYSELEAMIRDLCPRAVQGPYFNSEPVPLKSVDLP